MRLFNHNRIRPIDRTEAENSNSSWKFRPAGVIAFAALAAVLLLATGLLGGRGMLPAAATLSPGGLAIGQPVAEASIITDVVDVIDEIIRALEDNPKDDGGEVEP